MLKIENTEIYGWGPSIRGARNPMNSWDKADSTYHDDGSVELGPNDLQLLRTLANAGPDHGKFLRMIQVYCDIVGPLYWYKEADTYRAGVEKNSCSTMHKIHAKEFTLGDFSYEHLRGLYLRCLQNIITMLNDAREAYLANKDKKNWWQMIQLLPSSYNQRRTYMISYAALRSMYHARKNHKLDEWREFCRWIESLPYAKELIIGGENDDHC